ncbi:TPA: hypothetical protein HA278_05200 [Candidatus Woesearchaeota archaeon]|nr:hypothetical protein [archaeon]HIJ11427.1 hypothetical protein [Candidatus Woesearchaeota archaeon]|tara:strand:- start:488 stop:1534 length:1047 start_codon:yes stop_codon:yes gene_type:complete
MVDISVRSQVFSAPGLLLTDFAKTRSKDPEFKAAAKRLKRGYTLKKLARLEKRYLKDRAGFSKKLAEITTLFVQDYTRFRVAYTEFFSEINETLNVVENEEYQQLFQIYTIFDLLFTKVKEREGQFYFPATVTKAFQKKFTKAMGLYKKNIARESAALSGLAKHKRFAVGFFAAFVSSRSAERKGMRASSKLNTEAKQLQDAYSKIHDELEKGVQPDFLLLLLEYVDELTRSEELLERLRHDILIIMGAMETNVDEVIEKIAPFMVAIEQDPTVKAKIDQARNEFIALQKKVQKQIVAKGKWPKVHAAEIQRLTLAERKVLETLRGIREEAFKKEVNKLRLREQFSSS